MNDERFLKDWLQDFSCIFCGRVLSLLDRDRTLSTILLTRSELTRMMSVSLRSSGPMSSDSASS